MRNGGVRGWRNSPEKIELTEKKKISRRRFAKYVGGAVVAAAAVAAGYGIYEATKPPPTPPTTTVAPPPPTTTVAPPTTATTRQLVEVLYPDVDDLGIPDPAIGFSIQDFGRLMRNTYDPLIEYDTSSPPEMIPALAEKWEVSQDGLTCDFHLRKGVTFHDGTEVTADAVVYSMNRLLTVNQGVAFLWAGVLDTDSTQATDKYTVRFNLKKKYAPFPSTLAFLYVVNPKVIEAHIDPTGPYGTKGDYATKWLSSGGDIGSLSGSGPYMLKEWVIGDHSRMERYEEYWRGWSKPNPLDVIIAQKVPEEATVRQIVQKGGAFHISPFRSTDFYKTLGKVPNVYLVKSPKPFSAHYFHFNTTKPPLDDVHVRRALSYAFDYDQFLNNIRAGLGDGQLIGPLPRAFWGHNDSIIPYTLDLDKAKAELQQSKYSSSKLKQMPIVFYYIEPIEFERLAGLLLASNGEKIGLNMSVQTIPWLKFGEGVTKPETSPDIVAVTHSAPHADPDGLLYPLFHSTDAHTWARDPSHWTDPQVDKLLDDARATSGQDERAEMYEKAQQIINDAAPAIFAMEQASIGAADTHIQGIVYNWEYTFYAAWRYYWQA